MEDDLELGEMLLKASFEHMKAGNIEVSIRYLDALSKRLQLTLEKFPFLNSPRVSREDLTNFVEVIVDEGVKDIDDIATKLNMDSSKVLEVALEYSLSLQKAGYSKEAKFILLKTGALDRISSLIGEKKSTKRRKY